MLQKQCECPFTEGRPIQPVILFEFHVRHLVLIWCAQTPSLLTWSTEGLLEVHKWIGSAKTSLALSRLADPITGSNHMKNWWTVRQQHSQTRVHEIFSTFSGVLQMTGRSKPRHPEQALERPWNARATQTNKQLCLTKNVSIPSFTQKFDPGSLLEFLSQRNDRRVVLTHDHKTTCTKRIRGRLTQLAYVMIFSVLCISVERYSYGKYSPGTFRSYLVLQDRGKCRKKFCRYKTDLVPINCHNYWYELEADFLAGSTISPVLTVKPN